MTDGLLALFKFMGNPGSPKSAVAGVNDNMPSERGLYAVEASRSTTDPRARKPCFPLMSYRCRRRNKRKPPVKTSVLEPRAQDKKVVLALLTIGRSYVPTRASSQGRSVARRAGCSRRRCARNSEGGEVREDGGGGARTDSPHHDCRTGTGKAPVSRPRRHSAAR